MRLLTWLPTTLPCDRMPLLKMVRLLRADAISLPSKAHWTVKYVKITGI